MKRKLFLFLLVGLAFSLAGLQPAQAATITFELDYVFEGSEPDGAGPWLTATFDDDVDDDDDGIPEELIRLTMDATNLPDKRKVHKWWFNVTDDDIGYISFLNITYNAALSDVHGSSPYDGFGLSDNLYSIDPTDPVSGFDVELPFLTGTGSSFAGGDTVVYDFEFTQPGVPMNANSFFAVNASDPGPFYSAAHVSSWIADNPNASPVPEPATMLLVGMGLIGLAGFGRRRFKA